MMLSCFRGFVPVASLLLAGGSATVAGAIERTPPPVTLSAADHALLEDLERTAHRFFAEQAHPETGLVRDRARADGSPSAGKASIAASGFAFSSWVIAVERGWAPRDEAVTVLRRKLRFLLEKAPRHHGFFYHFMEMATGERAWKCEVSSIDSALMFSGAIVAREYFRDPEITDLVNRLLADVDWGWFRGDGQLVLLSWHDETGFSRYRWANFSEHLLMSFLALGISERPVEAGYWYAWDRTPVGRHGDFVYLQEPPLFIYQFPQAYMDLRDRRDGTVDLFHNARLATLAQRDFSVGLRAEFPTWGERLWGITASDSVTGYKAWGGPPRTHNFSALDGTIVPCASAGSLIFTPRESLEVLHHLRTAWGDRIWKRYGFVDAFNPETGWVNEDVIGIDLGISQLSAENLRTGLIHRLFMQAPEAQAALRKAGFLSTRRELNLSEQDQVRAAARAAWASLQELPASPGLQLTAAVAAQRLGLMSGVELRRAAEALLVARAPAAGPGLAQYAAAVAGLRQWLPEFAARATARLEELDWPSLAEAGGSLASVNRLGLFLQIARGLRPAAAWAQLDRATEARPPVHVLAPVSIDGAVLPGLWLDESPILSGASAAQLAFSGLYAAPAGAPDALTAALWLEHFAGETLERHGAELALLAESGGADGRAALLIAVANLLTGDSLRADFQRDPLVRAGRAAIPEFTEAAFGPHTSLYAQRELAGRRPAPERRQTTARRAGSPPESWDWQEVAGLQFKDSVADVRAGDAPLTMRFAFTWDKAALQFHAEVVDTPAGYAVPPVRNRFVELFIDPALDGLAWFGPDDRQFAFVHDHSFLRPPPGAAIEHFHGAPATMAVTPTAAGYRLTATIPWASLRVEPRAGLELGASAAVISEGTKEWEATLKLNWSYFRQDGMHARLGLLRLE
jgi:hypothetical protein